MKRKLAVILFSVCFSVNIWALWEGNASVGAPAEFPDKGFFVRSDLFPKHSLIEIMNVSKNKAVRAVVIGTSGTPNLLVSVSSEVAAALGMYGYETNYVKITLPAPVSEVAADSLSIEESRQETTAAVSTDYLQPSPVSMYGQMPKNLPVVQPPKSPEIVATLPRPVQSVAPLPAARTNSIESQSAPAYVPPIREKEETAINQPASVPFAPNTENPPEKTPEAAHVEPVQTAPHVTEKPAEEPDTVASVKIIPAPQQKPVPALDEIVEPIVLEVPEQTPPPVEQKSVEEIEAIQKNDDLAVKTVLPVLEVEPAVESAAAKNEENPETEPTDIPILAEEPQVKVVIPTPDHNERNDYIQIATYSDMLHVNNITRTYGNRYPITVKHTNDSSDDVIRVFVGPINPDEVGAVLEYFQKAGFTDALITTNTAF